MISRTPLPPRARPRGTVHHGIWCCRFVIKLAIKLESVTSSEEVGLLHDAQELLLVNFPIAITVSLIDHLLKLLIGHPLTQLLRDALQVLEGNLAGLIIVEEAERLQDFVLRVPVQDLVRHHLQELLVLDGAGAIVIHIRNHFLDLFLLWFEAERAHRDLQLLRINGARAIGIEEVEGLLDLLLLLFSQLLLLLPTGTDTTESHCPLWG